MCGRFYVEADDPEILALAAEMNRSPLAERFGKGSPLPFSGEILPSSVVPAVASGKTGERRVFPMKWGFSRENASGLLINARAETAALKPTFRESWEKHRCVLPASWYFEWDHIPGADGKKRPGTKYALRPETGGILWLAGLYRMEKNLPVFVILTRQADERIAWMHDRMPVMLPADCAGEWIRPGADPRALQEKCLLNVRWERIV